VATADYYRKQAATCMHMSRACSDPILAARLGSLAAEFLEAAADFDRTLGCTKHSDASSEREKKRA
jgi:hypothetical protein